MKSQLSTKPDLPARQTLMGIDKAIRSIPGAMVGDCFPLKHSFVEGAYVREISMPKGMLIVSKIHKVTHPYFVLKGKCSVLTEKGLVRIKAPYYGITLAGTKRILYIHEDCTWVTVHVTKETDLKKIEEEIIAPTFKDIPSDIIDIKSDEIKLMDFVTEAIKQEEANSETLA